MNSLDIIDYWITGRWRNKEKMKAWVNATGSQIQGISIFYDGCTLNIDDASGDQLDLIGEILGLERLKTVSSLTYFGYKNTIGATGYGKAPYLDKDHIGGYLISDFYYKIALKAKVLYNTTDSTRKSIMNATRLILGVQNIILNDYENMTFDIKILDEIDEIKLLVLNYYGISIIPSGTRFLGYLINTDSKLIHFKN